MVSLKLPKEVVSFGTLNFTTAGVFIVIGLCAMVFSEKLNINKAKSILLNFMLQFKEIYGIKKLHAIF